MTENSERLARIEEHIRDGECSILCDRPHGDDVVWMAGRIKDLEAALVQERANFLRVICKNEKHLRKDGQCRAFWEHLDQAKEELGLTEMKVVLQDKVEP
jgi:hypothetical protein